MQVTAFYGYGMAIPDQVKQCALVIAARLYQRKSSPLGFQAGSVDVGLFASAAPILKLLRC